MSFLRLPQEVLQDNLFWYLGYNDVLRMRRLCKYTKTSADDHIRVKKRMPIMGMDIHVESDHPHSLSSFLALDFPCKILHFEAGINDPDDPEKWTQFFEHEEMPIFLAKYGKSVTHLNVPLMQLPFWRPKEIHFYNSFESLESLSCLYVDTRNYDDWSEEEGSCLAPASFTRLKRLVLPNILTKEAFEPGLEERIYPIWRFFDGVSSQLDYFLHPWFEDAWQVHLSFKSCGPLTWVKDMIDGRPPTANLKTYNLRYFKKDDTEEDDTHSEHFMSLCESCANKGVKLKNVDPQLLAEYDISDEEKLAVAKTVLSLKGGFDFRVFKYDLPLLESIEIEASLSCLPGMEQLRGNPPHWPQLREIFWDMEDKNYTPDEKDDDEGEQLDKLEFVLFGQHRPNMKELTMQWNIWKKEKAHMFIPCPTSLTSSMSNLTKLDISGCLATNQFFVTLWKGLPQLKTVVIISCEKLGDEGFIGDNPSEPVFLKLQNLKDLQLSSLDKMPGITDALLYDVLRHISLQRLSLYSPNKSDNSRLTLAGIEALNTSLLAQSIVELDVDLANFTEEQVSNVVSQFRSSQMC